MIFNKIKDNYIKVWVKPTNDLKLQVGRAKSDDMERTASYIIEKLKISKKDIVLDAGCGNGILTKKISKKCKYINGVDFSKFLINVAKQKYYGKYIKYILSDVVNINQIFPKNSFDKVYCYSVIQYLNYKKGEQLIKNLVLATKPGGIIFIADIPHKKKKYRYIGNSFNNKIMHIVDCIVSRIKKRGQDSIGWWWEQKQISDICNKLNVKCKILGQPKDLPRSYYRFDILIRK